MTNKITPSNEPTGAHQLKRNERGAALILALIILFLLGAISITVLAVVSHEIRIASSDLRRTETYSAAASAIERMTNEFSALFQRTSNPSPTQLDQIAANFPSELTGQGFTFTQSLKPNTDALTQMQLTQGITNGSYPYVDIEKGPLSGLRASVSPYTVTATAYNTRTGAQVTLERTINNYLIPMFQFGTFSDGDLEFWPQPPMTFNGRVHANGNIYFGGDITFTSKVTTANEAVRTVLRNNGALPTGYSAGNPRFVVNGTTVPMTQGSVVGGPKLAQPRTDKRGNFPAGTPLGTDNASWNSTSIKTANGTANQFDGQLLTKGTGALPLLLPMQLDGKMPREIIKRSMPDDSSALVSGRFHSKAEIRILIDDESAGNGANNVAGIGNDTSGSQKGKALSSFKPASLDGGKALRVVKDDGTGYVAGQADWLQGNPTLNKKAETVRGIKAYTITTSSAASTTTGGKNATSAELTSGANSAIDKSPNGAFIPPGSGITGRILIEVRQPNGTWLDVTSTILSMGMTVGEPNGIVYLQRPLWAAYMQGGRDRKGDSNHNNYLNYFLDTSVTDRRCIADGEISKVAAFNASGYIYEHDNTLDDDPHPGTARCLPTNTTMARDDQFSTAPGSLNKIVPISVYNVREGRIDETNLSATVVYERGIIGVVDINMRNLARWLDGVYDNNLLNGTNAVSTNIDGTDGYVVYISDRRGDRVKQEWNAAKLAINTTNGLVDNEDVYGYNQANGDVPNPGEDVIDAGYDPVKLKNKKDSLQIDLKELPGPAQIAIPSPSPTPPSGVDSTDFTRSVTVAEWQLPTNASPFVSHPAPTTTTANAPGYYFRRAVRLLNGEDLMITGATGKLSATKGITVSTENMVFIWGNYNTTGISGQPTGASTPNDPTQTNSFLGDQIPTAIVSDAFFPLSKTWYDALPSLYPEGADKRIADAGSTLDSSAITTGQETSVRAGIISGTTMSAMVGTTAPTDYLAWLNGGVHNFPRFLETWGNVVPPAWQKRWNYVGSFILLYNSTQAVGPYSVENSVVYYPPKRNWGFDITFNDPKKLPPGTPQFQYIEATGFRQIF
jgi:hypothetical protein